MTTKRSSGAKRCECEKLNRELTDVLIAISVVSKRIADRISKDGDTRQISMEGGNSNGKSKRIVVARG